MGAALPVISALAPIVFSGIGALTKKPTEYTSGLSPQDQGRQNEIYQMMLQQKAQGPSKASRDAQAFLYRRFGLGQAPQYPGTPAGVPPTFQQQQPMGGGQPAIDPAMLAAFMQSRQNPGGPGGPGEMGGRGGGHGPAKGSTAPTAPATRKQRTSLERQLLIPMSDQTETNPERGTGTDTPHPSCGHPLPIRWGEGRGEGIVSS